VAATSMDLSSVQGQTIFTDHYLKISPRQVKIL
jgi:hypothetical protein